MKPTSSTWALAASFFLFSPSFAAYNLKDNYTPANFFSMFDFFTDGDPTDGYVDYQSQSAAQAASLISTANNQIYMGVDSTSVASGRGRRSVRVTSKAVYNHALILLDLEHMPGSICGVWPAFWTVGPNWPSSGEIDIIEGVNTQSSNAMTLHTGPGCSIAGPISGGSASGGGTSSAQGTLFSGSVSTSNCDTNASGQAQNAGCGITTGNQATYGSGLNAGKGGVYAMEWQSSGISIWYFPRSTIPGDITSGSPDPSSWSTPVAHFGGGGCSIDSSIKNQQIVFDTTFCGQWAGAVWSSDATCSSKAATCQDYVKNNPSAFQEAFWAINSLKVYTSDGAAAQSAASSAAPKSSAVSSKPPVFGSSSSAPVPIPASVFSPINSKTSGGLSSVSFTIPSGAPLNSPSSASSAPASVNPAPQTTTKPNVAPTGGQPWNGQSWSQGNTHSYNGGGNTQWSHPGGRSSQIPSASAGINGGAQVIPTKSISVAAQAINSAAASSSTSSSIDDQPYAVVVGPSGNVMEQPANTAAAYVNAVKDNSPAVTATTDTVSIPTSFNVVDPQFTVPTSIISAIASAKNATTTTFMTLTQSNPSPLMSLSGMSASKVTSAVEPWATWLRRHDNESAQEQEREEKRDVHAHMDRHRRHQRREHGHWASRRRM